MMTLDHNRLRQRRYVRTRARGNSREVACRAAGYNEHGATRIERRLKGEIELERRKLQGMNGHGWKLSRRDVHNVLDRELGRIVDCTGSGCKHLREHTLRALAEQVRLDHAREHFSRIEAKLHREAKAYGASARTLQLRLTCRELITRIERLKGGPAAGEDLASAGKAPVVVGSVLKETRAHTHEARCARHPSQRHPCKLCQFVEPPTLPPPRYGNDW